MNKTKKNKKKIIGYIHVCQKGQWEKSFDLLMDSIKTSKLYANTHEIRIGVVSTSEMIDNVRFNDSKIKIIHRGKDTSYERPTLLHMKKSSSTDPKGTLYYYLHTKGIRWFQTKHEAEVVKWIKSMLTCNIINWREAVSILKQKETYGCNYNNIHYAGNFWWATRDHIRKLSDKIPKYYTAPEDWVLTNDDNLYCANNCGTTFKLPYSDNLYK